MTMRAAWYAGAATRSVRDIEPESSERGRAPPANSVLPGVRDLGEELPRARLQLVGHVEKGAVVPVARVEDRLPIQLVGEERGAAEPGVLGRDREGVERGVALGEDVLSDQSHEGARSEGVRGAQAL